MNNNKKIIDRNSSFELMRIISMLFIVIYHVLVHSGILERATGTIQIITVIIESIIIIHVNSFVLLTGYFQCHKKRKISNILSIINATWFYKVSIMIIVVILHIVDPPGEISILHTILPLDYGTYWFINCYLILYIIAPILNIVITKSSKNELKNIIITLFIIISVLSTFSNDTIYNTMTGRSLSSFILLYFIGAYLRINPPEMTTILKKYSKNAKRIIYILGFSFCILMSLLCWSFNHITLNLHPYLKEIGSYFITLHISFMSPIIIIQSIFYFLYFTTYTFHSRLINKISSAALGVYLIHENVFIRETIYRKIGLTSVPVTLKIIIYVIILSFFIYIICTIIELIRKFLFRIIHDLKCSTNIRKKIRKYINNLGINVNW